MEVKVTIDKRGQFPNITRHASEGMLWCRHNQGVENRELMTLRCDSKKESAIVVGSDKRPVENILRGSWFF